MPSQVAATARLRAWPAPVATTAVACAVAPSRDSPGTIAITWPPAAAAPRDAASITPPRPPVTTTAPAPASNRPTSSASRSTSADARPAPATATYTGPRYRSGGTLGAPRAVKGSRCDSGAVPPL